MLKGGLYVMPIQHCYILLTQLSCERWLTTLKLYTHWSQSGTVTRRRRRRRRRQRRRRGKQWRQRRRRGRLSNDGILILWWNPKLWWNPNFSGCRGLEVGSNCEGRTKRIYTHIEIFSILCYLIHGFQVHIFWIFQCVIEYKTWTIHGFQVHIFEFSNAWLNLKHGQFKNMNT